MLGVAFALIVVTLLAGHHFMVERPRRLARQATTGPRPVPVRDVVSRLPAGVFLQPTFTWSQVRTGGDVEIGVHPMLLSLVGPSRSLETRGAGEHVSRGDPLFTLEEAGRELTVRSPIAGRVIAANATPPSGTTWQAMSDRTCLLEPDDLQSEIPAWMVGESAVDWSRTQYARIRDHLLARAAHPDTGLALADGGELPEGALAVMDPEDWIAFEGEFLTR